MANDKKRFWHLIDGPLNRPIDQMLEIKNLAGRAPPPGPPSGVQKDIVQGGGNGWGVSSLEPCHEFETNETNSKQT